MLCWSTDAVSRSLSKRWRAFECLRAHGSERREDDAVDIREDPIFGVVRGEEAEWPTPRQERDARGGAVAALLDEPFGLGEGVDHLEPGREPQRLMGPHRLGAGQHAVGADPAVPRPVLLREAVRPDGILVAARPPGDRPSTPALRVPRCPASPSCRRLRPPSRLGRAPASRAAWPPRGRQRCCSSRRACCSPS